MASNSPRLPSRRSIIATVAISAVAAVMVSLSSPASLRIDGQRMISDVPPVTTPKGEVFVPLRVVAETLGAETNYDPADFLAGRRCGRERAALPCPRQQ